MSELLEKINKPNDIKNIDKKRLSKTCRRNKRVSY